MFALRKQSQSLVYTTTELSHVNWVYNQIPVCFIPFARGWCEKTAAFDTLGTRTGLSVNA